MVLNTGDIVVDNGYTADERGGLCSMNSFPRVLLVGVNRVNFADNSNNGLFFRNLFGGWPRNRVAQIYASADNGDCGFFGAYYQLGPKDRVFGRLFSRLRKQLQRTQASDQVSARGASHNGAQWKSNLRRMLQMSGFYEIIFRPRLSSEMIAWVEHIGPDIICAPGYSLSFAWLPVMLRERLGLPIVFYPTDDWPDESYRNANGFGGPLSGLTHRAVNNASRRLVEVATVRCAFNKYMRDEYRRRYGTDFLVIMHGDDPTRFEAASPNRLSDPRAFWIVCTGMFDQHRTYLLHDLDEACTILVERGYRVTASAFPTTPLPPPIERSFRHLRCQPCPSHSELPRVLRAADLLFLPECFGGARARGIRLSISSKAPLFMFCGKPILVYADAITGISRYASDERWAEVVNTRDPRELAQAIITLMTNQKKCDLLADTARKIAGRNHNLKSNRKNFTKILRDAVGGA